MHVRKNPFSTAQRASAMWQVMTPRRPRGPGRAQQGVVVQGGYRPEAKLVQRPAASMCLACRECLVPGATPGRRVGGLNQGVRQ